MSSLLVARNSYDLCSNSNKSLIIKIKTMKTFHFFFCCLLILLTQNCQSQSNSNQSRDIANIKAAYNALNQRDWPTFQALCTDDFIDVNAAPTPTKGIKNSIELYKQFLTAFPDFKLNITDIASVGNGKYVVRLNATGTNTGNFMDLPATGKLINFNDADILILNAGGKCTSHESTNAGAPLAQIGYASMVSPSTQVVMAAYEAFGKSDIEALKALCDEKVVFDIQDRMFDSKERQFKGKEEVVHFFQELDSKVKYSKFQPTRFVADGDDVFILVDTEYVQPSTKKKFASTYTHQFKVVNGKITYFKGLDGFARPL